MMMKNVMKIGLFALALGIAQLFTSCTTQKLLSADFEGDAVGSLPSLGLPGDPSGDEMNCINCGSGDYRIIEKTTGSPPETKKWLEIFGNVRSATDPRVVQFIPIRGSLVDPVYTVTWKGSIVHPGTNSIPFSIDFYSGAFTGSQLFFSLTFKRETHRGVEVSSIYLRENGSDEEDAELIGRVRPGTSHTMTVFINTETRTFSVLGSGLPVTIEKPIPSSIANLREPRIWMSYYLEGIGVYQLDNIQIIEGRRNEE